ncbi:hypothetical protein FRC12_021102 [Ceratobasidium sp. 428]|nr:hypothetical protein FRC12_021102 [Ceratobasidium sp. 428]
MDAEVQIRMPLDIPDEDTLLKQPVFPLIHSIKKDIEEHLDTSLSWDQLVSDRSSYFPSTRKY